jgi:tRNA (guanine37-N1)-methyltransferase
MVSKMVVDRKIWFISLFPELIYKYFDYGVMSRVKKEISVINPASYSPKGFKGVDNSPYGGGPGMVMRVDVLARALEEGILRNYNTDKATGRGVRVLYTSPDGAPWRSGDARGLASSYTGCSGEDLVFICGRYEGIDQRFIDLYVDQVISVGDYVLSGGELPCLSIVDSIFRFVPGTLGNSLSAEEDSFESGYIDHPKWTRPQTFRGHSVPSILLSGNHSEIKEFNKKNQKPYLES